MLRVKVSEYGNEEVIVKTAFLCSTFNRVCLPPDVHIIISFIPNHSGKTELFVRSALKEDKYYNDLYLWYPMNYTSKPDKPPNNWVSIYTRMSLLKAQDIIINLILLYSLAFTITPPGNGMIRVNNSTSTNLGPLSPSSIFEIQM